MYLYSVVWKLEIYNFKYQPQADLEIFCVLSKSQSRVLRPTFHNSILIVAKIDVYWCDYFIIL